MKKRKLVRALMLFMMVAIIVVLSGCSNAMVLDPKGPVAEHQRDLIYISSILCLVILVPVLALTAWIVWRYRDRQGNKASYKPEWSHNTTMEIVWWTIPIVIIVTLAVITIKYTYKLEPSKALETSTKKPITVQVTSLDWKWLFVYPEQGIATVNYLQIPEDTPIKFELTSDAPMNSFWIPQLGGQIYTMSGMAMTLYLQADEIGHYFGTGANFSGEHFADMTFDVNATSQQDFDAFVDKTKKVPGKLTQETYEELAAPGKSGVRYYSSVPDGLFEQTVTKYMKGDMGHGGHSGHGTSDAGSEKAAATEPKAATDHSQMSQMDHSHMNMAK
ncbi:ubiquinol oxidase subunit II [Paenibacillus oryzisoli]|uniref:ubiquinol oxidase subunit II n=1 Tax=Paenibacillus oryzisoli TaxID=1850517 RepID=UPI003D2A8954